jgi:hypothetical protein
MPNMRLAMNPLLQDALILVAASLVSSLLCIQVYG